MKLEFQHFSGFATCRFRNNVYLSNVPEFSYLFHAGSYALLGQIDHGGWGVTYALDPMKNKDVYVNRWKGEDTLNKTKFFLDDKEVSLEYLQSISYMLGEYDNNKSAKKQITKALQRKKSSFTTNDLKSMFELSDERFDRPLNMTGDEIWRITTAIGLANGKRVFCYPWLTNNFIKPLLYTTKHISEIIKKNDCILLIPIENEDLVRDFVDDIIDLS